MFGLILHFNTPVKLSKSSTLSEFFPSNIFLEKTVLRFWVKELIPLSFYWTCRTHPWSCSTTTHQNTSQSKETTDSPLSLPIQWGCPWTTKGWLLFCSSYRHRDRSSFYRPWAGCKGLENPWQVYFWATWSRYTVALLRTSSDGLSLCRRHTS